MGKWIYWMLFSVALVFSLSLLVVGLLAGGIALNIHALILALTPVTGAILAYVISGAACISLVVLLFAVINSRMKHGSKTGNETAAAGAHSAVDTYHSARVILEKYPLESVMVAFAAGLAANDTQALQKLTTDLLREA